MIRGCSKEKMAEKTRSTKSRRESVTDIQERAALMIVLQEYIKQRPGTQAEKAKALGITQPRLNDLLKERIDKFSLDALVSLATSAGLRVNVNIQPVHIHTGLGAISLKRRPALSIFAPSPNELGKLNSELGTSVFLALLRCETVAVGLSPKDVVLSLDINVKDGGIDAKVENSPATTSLLNEGSTYFQIKTGESFKPWWPSHLKKELFGKTNASPSKKLLGSEIKNCLDRNGTYSIVTFGHDLLPNQHTAAVKELVSLLNACGYENPSVCIYGQGQLVGELDKYPSICLDLIGLDEGGFLSIQGWRRNAQMQLPLEVGDKQQAFISDIQTILCDRTYQHIRVIGEPGIGKTRSVLEAVSIEDISSSVIYVPSGEDFQKSRLFSEILKPDRGYSATLIIDDCDNRDRASIWSALKGHSGIRLITIDHGPDESHDSTMKTLLCPQLEEGQINNILYGYLNKNTDLRNWASWCNGSPRVAHAVGENLRSNPEDILKSPADVPIWDRFIVGHKEMSSHEAEHYRVVLRYIALFQRFGFESPVNEEGQFICNLIQEVDPTITWGRFQQIIQYYRNKRILQGSHTLFIVPKALHIYLWVEFWKNHGHGFQFQEFLEKIPASMRRWFLQLFIYAHAAEPARAVVKDILSPTGPFSNQNFLESEVGMRFLNYLSEADPSSTLSLLERTVKTWSHEKLFQWKTGRQDIVWALEKISVWDELFFRAIDLLIPMALAENANNSNNSKGLLLSLFCLGYGWAPTQAPPSKRVPILQELVKSTDSARRTLGLELCGQWFKTHGVFRRIGAEYQGLRPAIQFWRPKTYGEVFESWREVLKFLTNEMKGFSIADRNQATNILINASKGLLRIQNMSDEVMDILFELAQDKEINRKSITQFVIWELRQNNEGLGKNMLSKFRQLDKILTGESLWERITRYVLHTNWDEEYRFRGDEYSETNLPGERVKKLAKEYMNDTRVFGEHLEKLASENGHRLPEFGVECGKLSTSEFDDKLFSYVRLNASSNNGMFVGGYLVGLRTHNAERWEKELHQLLHDEELRNIAIDCIDRSGFTESLLRDMILLLADRKLTSSAFNRFAIRPNLCDINEEFFQELVTTLLDNPDDTTASICTQLVHDRYFENENHQDFPEELVFDVITVIPISKDQDQMYEFYWGRVAESFINKFPNRSIELLSHILGNMGDISHYGSSSYIAKLADKITAKQPQKSWEVVSGLLASETNSRYDIIDWLCDSDIEDLPRRNAISYMPAEEIISWAKIDTENRLWLVQEMMPKTLDLDAGGLLTRLYIEEFCDDDRCSSSLFAHFHMGCWIGPESDHLSKIRDLARKWLSEIQSTKVQLWLGKFIEYLSSGIESTLIQEEREF